MEPPCVGSVRVAYACQRYFRDAARRIEGGNIDDPPASRGAKAPGGERGKAERADGSGTAPVTAVRQIDLRTGAELLIESASGGVRRGADRGRGRHPALQWPCRPCHVPRGHRRLIARRGGAVAEGSTRCNRFSTLTRPVR